MYNDYFTPGTKTELPFPFSPRSVLLLLETTSVFYKRNAPEERRLLRSRLLGYQFVRVFHQKKQTHQMSASSSSSSRFRGSYVTSSNVICYCGSSTFIRTSWTDKNPGRRFHCCNGKCGFVSWVDPETCPRALQIIPGLIKNKNKLEESNKQLEALAKRRVKEVRKWKIVALTSWLCLFFFVICNLVFWILM
ncbi:hypothetical protein R6Q59_034015 [Mikania micrantha]